MQHTHSSLSRGLVVTIAVAAAVLLTGCKGEELRRWLDLWSPANVNCVRPGSATLAASAGEVLYLAASAHVTGALGTDWRSDVELHNLSEENALVTLWLLVHGADNSSPASAQITVPAGSSVRLADVLAGQFSLDGQAALMLSVGSGRILATSRTYNLLAAGNPLGLPGGSTFGQFIPALERSGAIAFGEEGRLIQLSHSTATSGGFRTNLGLVNITSSSLDVEVELYTASGTPLGTVSVTLPPFGYQQLNRVFASVTAGDVDDGYAVVRTTTAGGSFFAYASVVDNLTGDPIAITAEKVPVEEPAGRGEPVYLVAAAHLSGVGGTNWRTDAEIHCWGDVTASFRIELLEHGVDNSTPGYSASYTLEAGRSLRLEDLLDSEFGFSGAAAVRVTTYAGHVLVTSRTYNLLGEGNDAGLPAGATFGQYIPGVTMADAIREGEEGRLIQLSHTPGGASGFRTNLVLVNASPKQIAVEVDLYSSDGALLGTVNRTLLAHEYRQLNGVFEQVTGSTVADGYAVVRTTTSEGAVFALASVVDNLTGDPVGLGAAVVLSAGAEGLMGEVGAILEVMGGTTLESAVDGMQTVGLEGMLDGVVSAQPEVARRTPEGYVLDYGEGTVRPDGSVWSGATAVDASGLSVTSDGISGTMTITNDGFAIDGEPSPIGSTSLTFDLAEREDGTVAGTMRAEPVGSTAQRIELAEAADGTVAGAMRAEAVGPNTAEGALSGTLVLDSALCERFPISGSLTFVYQGQVITIVPSPDCDGTVDGDVTTIPPDADFAFSFGDPTEPRGLAFIDSTSNAKLVKEGRFARFWQPGVGGETFGESPPGVVTLHVAFDRPIVSGSLVLKLTTFYWSYSRGHNFLFGSTDGLGWQQLAEVPPPDAEGGARDGGWNGPLPAMFIGATDIWLQARLYSYGTFAGQGATNTAQLFRFDVRNSNKTFNLVVNLQDP